MYEAGPLGLVQPKKWMEANSNLPNKEPYQEIVDLVILKNPNFQPLYFDTAKQEISNIEIDRARL